MYPTAEQIMAEPMPLHRKDVVRFVFDWKRAWTGRRRTREGLTALASGIASIYGKSVDVRFTDGLASLGTASPDGAITLDAGRGSVVTTLHELAHVLFPSEDRAAAELKACRWSVWLFKKTFPATFARCRFEGHVLVLDSRPLPRTLELDAAGFEDRDEYDPAPEDDGEL
jgi:hypothetical protein